MVTQGKHGMVSKKKYYQMYENIYKAQYKKCNAGSKMAGYKLL